jgi:hypothetical protein
VSPTGSSMTSAINSYGDLFRLVAVPRSSTANGSAGMNADRMLSGYPSSEVTDSRITTSAPIPSSSLSAMKAGAGCRLA